MLTLIILQLLRKYVGLVELLIFFPFFFQTLISFPKSPIKTFFALVTNAWYIREVEGENGNRRKHDGKMKGRECDLLIFTVTLMKNFKQRVFIHVRI